jgi:hypothetical protein
MYAMRRARRGAAGVLARGIGLGMRKVCTVVAVHEYSVSVLM